MGVCPECGANDWDDGELVITTPMLLGAKTTYLLNFESYDNKKRKILVDILSDLEEIKPIMDAKKFLEIMDRINTEFGKSLFSKENDIDLKNIFQKQSLYERMRGYLVPLIPIATIIINVFLEKL